MPPIPTKRGGAREGSGRKKVLKEKHTVAVVLEADDLARLDALAAHRNLSRSALVRELINLHLAQPAQGQP